MTPRAGEGPLLVSACLAGRRCRYDGTDRARDEIVDLVAAGRAHPVCPEELGGLGTPRVPAGLVGGGGAEVLDGRARVVDRQGRDVTEAFLRGARGALAVARDCGATRALLKQHSPSCGVGSAGRAGGGRIPADGVTAALLRREGLEIQGDEEPGA